MGLNKNFPIFAVPIRGIAYGGLAQLVEHRTENPCVPGSSPGSTTMIDFKSLSCLQEGLFCFLLPQQFHPFQSIQLKKRSRKEKIVFFRKKIFFAQIGILEPINLVNGISRFIA